MSIFNSLGSNYDLEFVLKALFSQNKSEYPKKLKELLQKKFQGKAILLYKGREAITLALKLLNLPHDSCVAINGLTCYAVYKAIKEAGLEPVLVDIPKDDLNFTRSDLVSIHSKNPEIKVVIIQNTLGYPCDIEEIAKICRGRNLILIEDLAHCVGTKYKTGKEAGTIGDLTIFSFSQDKIIDAVSGGAIVIRNKKFQNQKLPKFNNPSFGKTILDRFYPILTWKIRVTYAFGVGKILHFILRNLRLLSSPMDNSVYKLLNLPNFYQSLALDSIKELKKNIEHRKKIANIYKKNLNKKIISERLNSQVNNSSNLRFPIFVNNREGLIKFLKNKGVYVSDIWYDAPIAPQRFMTKINYNNACLNSEKISSLILNLPTHKNISEKNAVFITKRVNEWLKLQ